MSLKQPSTEELLAEKIAELRAFVDLSAQQNALIAELREEAADAEQERDDAQRLLAEAVRQNGLKEFAIEDLNAHIRRTGLTSAELDVLEMITGAWNAFVALPRCHPMELQEGCTFVHGLQSLLINRVAVRAYPDVLRSVEGFE